MAGLVAAARARELGAQRVVVYEKGSRPGGSMLLSSGVVWRHLDLQSFRDDCARGDERLQREIVGRLDDDLVWLERLGAPVVERQTGNERTRGWRFDVRGLTRALVRQAGELRLNEPLHELPGGVPVLLATGGFQGDRALLRQHVTAQADHLLLRANRWSAGDGLRLGLSAGAQLTAGMDEIYGRNMPAPPARVAESELVKLAQLYARYATVENLEGERFVPDHWSEIDVVQWTARQPRARARYRLAADLLTQRVSGRTVGEMVDAAARAGGVVQTDGGELVVEVVAGVTTTLGGLRVDGRARAADGLYAAGTDAGGVSLGGYSSGLAAALVFGRIAAEDALGRPA